MFPLARNYYCTIAQLNICMQIQSSDRRALRKVTSDFEEVLYNIYVPNTKKFGCVGRGDLTFLFKSCEIDKSQRRLVY